MGATLRRGDTATRRATKSIFSPFVKLAAYANLAVFVLCLTVVGQDRFSELRDKIAVGSDEEKRSALYDIRNLANEEASRIAIPALSDSKPIVRATAVSSVIFLPHDEVLKLLIPLLKDKDDFVRRETASAFGELGDPNASDALIDDLRSEKDLENVAAAAMALGKIGNPAAIDPLAAILKKKPAEKEEFVRRSAARSIGEIAQIQRFGKRQTTRPMNFFPEKFKESFGEPNAAVNFSIEPYSGAVNVLRKVLANKKESDDTRREAAFALGTLGDTGSLTACVSDADNYLAEICKEALPKSSPIK